MRRAIGLLVVAVCLSFVAFTFVTGERDVSEELTDVATNGTRSRWQAPTTACTS